MRDYLVITFMAFQGFSPITMTATWHKKSMRFGYISTNVIEVLMHT